MRTVTADLLRANKLPVPEEGDKGARGQVLIVGGSREVPGAVLLAANAAMRAGAGKLQIATSRSVAPALGVAIPESLVIGLDETRGGSIAPDAVERIATAAEHADAILIGPGMMEQPSTDTLTAGLLAHIDCPAIIDAGALGCLPGLAHILERHAGRFVITPHAGEMASLLGCERDDVTADPLAAARKAASRLGCTVVMKGASTHIVSHDGEAWLFEGGTVGLATSGSGDTLAGIVAGLLARGTAPAWAAVWGVYLHGEAGTRLTRRYGGIGLLAREIPDEVPAIMAELG